MDSRGLSEEGMAQDLTGSGSGTGSCNGRGPRTAAWFADYLQSMGDDNMQSLILEGGIKGWVKAGEEYTEWMAEFDASKW